jgi:DNA-binding transcriptional LysR family regulator
VTLQQLSYFIAAVEHGSFGAAAKALRLAQPSVSEAVRQLEGELGVELFARVGRGIVLTEAGDRFRPRAERILLDVDRARESVAAVRELRGGTLSFGMFAAASAYLIADLVVDFRRRFPDIRLRLIGQNSSEVAERVREGKLEAALVVLPIDDDGLDVRPARREELVYASREPLRLREPMTIERLAQAPLILYDAYHGNTDPTRRQLVELAQHAGVSLQPVIDVEDMAAAIALAGRGLGDTVVARAALARRRGRRTLGMVSFAEPIYDTFAFISRRGAPTSPATRAFVELVERRLATIGTGVLLYAASPALDDELAGQLERQLATRPAR